MALRTGWRVCARRYRVGCFFLAANCLFEDVGLWTHELNLAAGALLLLLLALGCWRSHTTRPPARAALAGLALLAIGTALLPGEAAVRGAGLGLVMGALLLWRAPDDAANELAALALAAIAYGIYRTLHLSVPALWYPLESVAGGLAVAVSTLTGAALTVGSSFGGLHVTILVWIMLATGWAAGWRSWRRLLAYGAGALALNAAYLTLFALFPVVAGPGFQVLYPLYLLPGLVLADLGLLLLYFTPDAQGDSHASATASRSGLAAAGVALGVFAVLYMPPLAAPGTGAVVFYEKGYLNWLSPSFTDFGSGSAGMFGNLPRFLAATGRPTRRVAPIDDAALRDASVLVLINVESPLGDDEVHRIWRFVESGGSLLVLGDHTMLSQGKNWLNEILAPTAIRLNFDSANFFVGGWLHSLHLFRHPVTLHTGDRFNDPGIVVGASLDIAPPAVPVVIGKYGYSDHGDLAAAKNGYLGNLEYDPGEHLGDVVLAAVQPYGAGQVMVFGDTSGFANAILVSSYPFIERVFAWLQAPPRPPPGWLMAFLAIAGLGGAAAAVRPSRPGVRSIVALSAACVAAALAADALAARRPEPQWQDRIAYIDSSHFQRFSLDGWRDQGNMGLFLNVMRNGYLTFAMNEFDAGALRNASLFVTVAPRKPYAPSAARALRDFVGKGGRLLVSVGYEEREAIAPLLADFGFSIDNIPLGTLHDLPTADGRAEPAFHEAWPVRCTGDGCETLVEYAGFPLVANRPIGNGLVTVIGDSDFLLNRNLEHEDHPHMKSIIFLRWLLERMAPGGTPAT